MKINSQDFISIASAVTIITCVLGGGAWMHADLKDDIQSLDAKIDRLETSLRADIAKNEEAINENGKAIARISEILEGIKETLTSTAERLDLVEAKQDDHSGRIIRLETKLEKSR